MKSIIVVLILAALLPACTALETNVVLSKSYNLSVDLGPGFNISSGLAKTSSQSSMPIQVINITDSKNHNENATLTIFSAPTRLDSAKMAKLLALMENMMVGYLEIQGYTESGKQLVVTSNEQNATIHVMKPVIGVPSYLAVWGIDELNGIIAMSFLDQNNTTRIVKTLKIKP